MNKSVDIGKIREQIVQFVSFGYSVAEIDVADMVNICDEIERLRAVVQSAQETLYLLGNPKNADRLMESIAQIKSAKLQGGIGGPDYVD
jgi:hypothetical protein